MMWYSKQDGAEAWNTCVWTDETLVLPGGWKASTSTLLRCLGGGIGALVSRNLGSSRVSE